MNSRRHCGPILLHEISPYRYLVRHLVEGSFAVAKMDQLPPLSNRPYSWQVALTNGPPLVLYTDNGCQWADLQLFQGLHYSNVTLMSTLVRSAIKTLPWDYRNLEHFQWKCPQMNATRLHWWLVNTVNTGSGNGLVPSGNKPLPEPMLTQICAVTRP